MSYVPQFEIGPQQWMLISLAIFMWVRTGKIKRRFRKTFGSAAVISARRKDERIQTKHDPDKVRRAWATS